MTQREMIQAHLVQFGSITPEQARTEYACARLSARISELREYGFIIETVEKTITNRFGKKVTFAEKYVLHTCRTCIHSLPGNYCEISADIVPAGSRACKNYERR